MSSAPGTVVVWSSQLRANDFPPVCAMTGAPAETWRMFRFSNSPWWAFWIGGILLARATARRASGYLPMTRAGARSIRTVRLSFLVFIVLMAVFWLVAVAVASFGMEDRARSGIAVYFGLFGSFFMFEAIVVVLLTHRFGPVGRVLERQPGQYDSIVELRQVHPAFVAAVRQHQQLRAAQPRLANSESSK